jgi:hypothetical protein
MNVRYLRATILMLLLGGVAPAFGEVVIGDFDGGVAEPGWGRFSSGVQPLDANVYTVTDLGDGGALETNLPGFSDSFGYSFSTAGTTADLLANKYLVFDLIYRGTATNLANGGYSQVFQVIFQRNDGMGGFPSTAYQSNSDGVALSSFNAGGTSAGWGAGTESVQMKQNVKIDYSTFKNAIPGGLSLTTLQFWMSTNDDNRIYKAIDNVRLVPEPASIALAAVVSMLLALVGRRRMV